MNIQRSFSPIVIKVESEGDLKFFNDMIRHAIRQEITLTSGAGSNFKEQLYLFRKDLGIE